MQKTRQWFTPEGDAVTYRTLATRLPDFLASYGPAQGYAVTTEFMDPLTLKPGLQALYSAAMSAGHKPEAVGLPPLTAALTTTICRAVLQNTQGQVLATATAAKAIQAYKDLEILETAARQRLLAALGFGGEAFEDDEAQDGIDQQVASQSAAGDAPRGSIAVTPLLPEPRPEAAPQASRTAPDSPVIAPLATDVAPPIPAVPAALETAPVFRESFDVTRPEPAGLAATQDPALVALGRQIAHHARLRGLSPPPFSTREEARQILRDWLTPAPAGARPRLPQPHTGVG